jgi:hypothetical protein
MSAVLLEDLPWARRGDNMVADAGEDDRDEPIPS